MRCAIHQPHFFPWLGYLDKMAKADAFVLLDEVQLEISSYMVRNRLAANNGQIGYLTMTIDRKGYLDRKYNEIETKNNDIWKQNGLNKLREYYRKAPGYQEVMEQLTPFFDQEYHTACEWAVASIKWLRGLLEIHTPLYFQKDLDYDTTQKRSDLVLSICQAMQADTYLSGRGGSVRYLDREKFAENGVKIVFQDFVHPVYPQRNTTEFLPGLSSLDMLFNCGIEQTKAVFWENVKRGNEFLQ